MKTFRHIPSIFFAIAFMIGLTTTAAAQKNTDWKEKMMSEKIAFFTTEMNLTPEEAQKFWPVYNAYCKEEDEAHRKIMKTFKELNEAISSEKSSKEISAYLNRYLKAREDKRELSNEAAERFKKVLPDDKVARLYIAEEKFRRNQIHRLHHNHGPKK